MTKYAEGVRKQYKQWLVKPRKAAEILKERGDIEVAEQILTEINEIENLIEQIHGGMYAPETPADKMHIHYDIIERSALLDVHEKLRPIYAELNRLEREQTRENNAAEPTKQNKKNIFQKIFGRRNKPNKDISNEDITSYTDECVRRYEKFKRGPEIDKHLIGEYYEKFIKSEKDEYIQTFLGLLENLQTKSKEKLLSEQECADWILKGIPAPVILKYKEKIDILKKFQTFNPDNRSSIIRKALLETYFNNTSEIYEQVGLNSFQKWHDLDNNVISGTLLENDIIKNITFFSSMSYSYYKVFSNDWDPYLKDLQEHYYDRIENHFHNTKVDGRFFQFANRVLYKSPNEEIDLLLSIAENIIQLEKSVYISDKAKQQALITLLCDGKKNPKRRQAFELYFQIKDLYEGFKSELPREYEEAKKQTADSYAYALTEIKNRLAELIKMKQDFYSKTPEEIERLYGGELVR